MRPVGQVSGVLVNRRLQSAISGPLYEGKPSPGAAAVEVVLTLLVAVPVSVFAIERFTDVPNSNTLHSPIAGWPRSR